MKYICKICGYIYDEAKEGTPFSALPDDWKCPVCTAPKADFKAEEAPAQTADASPAGNASAEDVFIEPQLDEAITNTVLGAAAISDNPAADIIATVAAMTKKEQAEEPEEEDAAALDTSYDDAILNSVAMSDEPVLNIIQTIASLKKEIHEHEADPDLKKLSVGQLAALCSNLARGCEKQYKEEEAALFRELAAYFTTNTPAVADATVDDLAKAMQADIDNYAEVRKAADAAGDRGAARICVWGEKVTLMLSSLVSRYLQNGEALLADTEIWVCTACGFVFIGDTPPQQCPVCKVPDWKFEKIERRAAK